MAPEDFDEQIKRLSTLDVDNILLPEDPHFKLGEMKGKLELLRQGAADLINTPAYWNELPTPTQKSLVEETNTLMRVIDEIAGTKDNTSWLTSQLPDRLASLQVLYEKLYKWYVAGIREYKSANETSKKQVRDLVKEIDGLKATLVSTNQEASEAAKNAKDAASTVSTVELSQHFDEVANGAKIQKTTIKNIHKYSWWILILFQDSYKMAAQRWLIGVYIFTAITGVVAYSILHDVGEIKTLEEVLAKALILGAPAYGIKFSARNYRINKDHQVKNAHRAVVMKTLLAFLSREGLDDQTRNRVVEEAASQAFRYDPSSEANQDIDSVFDISSLRR